MKRIGLIFLLINNLCFAQNGRFQGNWSGSLTLQGKEMDILVELVTKDDILEGSMSSATQQFKGLALSKIETDGDSLGFTVLLAGGKWKGKLDSDNLLGQWVQGPYKLPLNFYRVDHKPDIVLQSRVQTPLPPYSYDEIEVKYTNDRDNVELAGTLTIPKGQGPFPAAILLTVAGLNDRDQSHGAPQHKPYKVLADYLTKRGIAVLRADDRGIGGSSGDLYSSTIENFAYDALAAFEFLKYHERIDSLKIGFIGNSEGSLVGPLAASINKETAFIVTLGGIGIPGSDVILDQTESFGGSRNRTSELIQILKTQSDKSVREQKLRALLTQSPSKSFMIPQSIDDQVALFDSPWYKFQINYDPAPVLQSLNCPFLAIHGSQDPFVSPDKNLNGISKNLQLGGNEQYSIVKLKDVNHVFQDAKDGSPLLYSINENSFSERALIIIGSWLKMVLLD